MTETPNITSTAAIAELIERHGVRDGRVVGLNVQKESMARRLKTKWRDEGAELWADAAVAKEAHERRDALALRVASGGRVMLPRQASDPIKGLSRTIANFQASFASVRKIAEKPKFLEDIERMTRFAKSIASISRPVQFPKMPAFPKVPTLSIGQGWRVSRG
jgi:hypothetical protein